MEKKKKTAAIGEGRKEGHDNKKTISGPSSQHKAIKISNDFFCVYLYETV